MHSVISDPTAMHNCVQHTAAARRNTTQHGPFVRLRLYGFNTNMPRRVLSSYFAANFKLHDKYLRVVLFIVHVNALSQCVNFTAF